MSFSMIFRRALVAGLAAGLALAVYTLAVVEPVIDRAIALEERLAEAGGAEHAHDEALFTRSEQTAGGAAAVVIYAVAVSIVFATVFGAVRHRLPGTTDLARVTWLATVGFGAVSLVPAIKYPANPPAVGDPGTVDRRTVLYLVLVVASLLLAWLLTRLSAWLGPRATPATRVVSVAGATVAGYGVVLAVLPASPDAIDPAVPASLVWDFRLRSIGGLALLWATFGVGLAWLLERASAMSRAGATAAEPCPAG